jgi:hypothetical protein
MSTVSILNTADLNLNLIDKQRTINSISIKLELGLFFRARRSAIAPALCNGFLPT